MGESNGTVQGDIEMSHDPTAVLPVPAGFVKQGARTLVDLEGIGKVSSPLPGDVVTLSLTALCVLNDPQVNKYFLASALGASDPITGTKLFPRAGMALPGGEVYKADDKEEDNGTADRG